MLDNKSYRVTIQKNDGEEVQSFEVKTTSSYKEGFEEQIALYNSVISRLMKENENLLEANGYQPPKINYAIKNPWDRIQIPSEYVRTLKKFRSEYNIKRIFPNSESERCKDFVLHLQMTDLFNYILNRTHLFGGILTITYKYSLINVISIIEVMVKEAAINVNLQCKECNNGELCEHHDKCQNYIKMRDAVFNGKNGYFAKLCQKGYLELDEIDRKEIMKLYRMRNDVHLGLGDSSSKENNQADQEAYNKSIKYLKEINEQIVKNMVPYYNKCKGFVEK